MRFPLRFCLIVFACWAAWASAVSARTLAHATLGGGCFWAMQERFEMLRGVISASPGYAGGHTANPSYEQVSSGATGHAEVVDITYDPAVISYSKLLGVFFGAHDPTTLNRQEPDEGTNYRSIILTRTPREAAIAHRIISKLTHDKAFHSPIVTEVKPLSRFYPAEAYHDHFCERNAQQGYCRSVVSEEVSRFKTRFAGMLKP